MRPGNLFLSAIAAALATAAGAGAVLWSVQAAQLGWRHAGLSSVALQIAGEAPFKSDAIARLAPKMAATEGDVSCAPAALHDVAVIRLRLAESAIVGGKSSEIDPALHNLDATARKSLRCSPLDPFLWLALYWVDTQINGARPDRVPLLEMSYRLGPNEGWIALRRSRYGLSAYDYVSPAVRETILDEERSLLNAGLVDDVEANLIGPGWPIHDLILARFADVDAIDRERLAKDLRRDGYDLIVPGVTIKAARPWD
jgi:hypothetical protein